MSLFTPKESALKRQSNVFKLQKQMQSLRNEMEFIEILAQFWPLPNMSEKMERLQQQLHEMSHQCQEFTGLSADQAGSIPFQRRLISASPWH